MEYNTSLIEHHASNLRERLEMDDLSKSMTFTLADAIREGSSLTEQCVGGWTDSSGSVCALSAAMISLSARHLI